MATKALAHAAFMIALSASVSISVLMLPAKADIWSQTVGVVGHAIEDTTHGVGHTAEKAGQDAGHTLEKAAHDVGKTSEKAGQDTGHTVEKALHDTGTAIEKGMHDTGHAIEKAGQDLGKFLVSPIANYANGAIASFEAWIAALLAKAGFYAALFGAFAIGVGFGAAVLRRSHAARDTKVATKGL